MVLHINIGVHLFVFHFLVAYSCFLILTNWYYKFRLNIFGRTKKLQVTRDEDKRNFISTWSILLLPQDVMDDSLDGINLIQSRDLLEYVSNS